MTRRWSPVAALAGICLLSACNEQKSAESPEASAASEPAITAPALPVAEKPLDREALLLAVAQTASNVALGREDREAQRMLDGKPFELRLRFGCANDDDQSRTWSYDEKRRNLSVRIAPEINGSDRVVQALGESGYEAVEGFWVRRPWQLDADCSAPSAPVTESPSPSPSPASSSTASAVPPTPIMPIYNIGLAQFYTAADSRTHRRESRAYSASKILNEKTSPSSRGYDLVIAGRLRKLSSGAVIACRNRGSAVPPDCIVSVQIDKVVIRDPADGASIAEWSSL